MTEEHPPESRNRLQPHHIVIAVCALLLLLFAILNIDDVPVDFAVDSVNAPLVLVIFLCALLGFVIGWFVGRRRSD